MSVTHGLASTYRSQRSACRCDACRAANTARVRLERVARRQRQDAIPPDAHGKHTTYSNWGCRCKPCTAANAALSTRHRMKVRAGLSSVVEQYTERGNNG